MDLQIFGFRSRPFRPTPNPGVFFASRTHSATCEGVLAEVSRQSEIAAITGEPGLGKSLVGLRCLSLLPKTCKPIVVQTPRNITPLAILQAILFDLAKPYHGFSEQELRLTVHELLLGFLESGQSIVLFVDEAHNLNAATLEELRLLGNLCSQHDAAITIILAGLPLMLPTVAAENPAFHNRIGGQFQLEPLDRDESIQYLEYQIRTAGGNPELFNDEAYELIAMHTRGVPRLLNRAAALSLSIAAHAGDNCHCG